MLDQHPDYEDEFHKLMDNYPADAGDLLHSLDVWEQSNFAEWTPSVVVCRITDCPILDLRCLMGSTEWPASVRVYVGTHLHLAGKDPKLVLLHLNPGTVPVQESLPIVLRRFHEMIDKLRTRVR